MKTILSIGAHPDDIEIGCGGTEILLSGKGHKIIHVIVTSGEEGNIDIPKQKLSGIREQEAKDSAHLLGAKEILFLRYPDSLTAYDKPMKMRMINIIRKFRPDILFTHAASDEFPDHKIVHELAMSAITAAAGPWFAEAEGKPHVVSNVFGYEVWHPIQRFQTAVSIDSVIEKKLLALSCHRSQIEKIDYLSATKGLAAYRGLLSVQSKYAEVFEVIRTDCLAM